MSAPPWRCKDCFWHVPTDPTKNKGECHLHPPKYPVVTSDVDWCSELRIPGSSPGKHWENQP